MADRPSGERVPEVGTVLISGPPMTGKYRLFVSLLSRHCERLGLISTNARAERIRSDFADAPADLPADRIDVIDCVRGAGATATDERVRTVGSPRNLTEIGVKFTELADEFGASPLDDRTGVGLYSVSHLLMFSSVETVRQFLRVLTGQITSNGWYGLAVLDDTTADEEAVQTIEHLFDAVVETRERDGTCEFRVRELPSASSGWTPLTI